MHIEVTRSIFHDAFCDNQYSGSFSYWALDALYSYLTNAENESQELDITAIACDFTEATYVEIIRDYDTAIDLQDEDGADRPVEDVIAEVTDWLEYRTVVVDHEYGGNFLFGCNF